MSFLQGRNDLRDVDVEKDWRLILTEEEIDRCVSKCANHINEYFAGQEVVVACVLKGAVYFHVDLTRKLTIPHSCYFIEASSYLNEQKQSEELEILSVIKPEKFQGKKVILVDELFDNGVTINEVRQKIHECTDVPLDDIYTCVAFMKDKAQCLGNPIFMELRFLMCG
jgi:hypoxanthine phosphoribosyltransferase